MKVQVKPPLETKSTKVDLIDGTFNQSESTHLLNALIDEKINFHKIQKWQKWESDHSFDSEDIDSRISELQNQKEEVKKWLKNLNNRDFQIKIESTIQISVEN